MEEEKERAIASGGAIPTHQKTRFTLFLPGAFYNNGEFKEHSDKFADRFNLKKVSLGPKDSADSYIDKVFEIVKKYNADSENTIKMSYNKMVVLVPDNVKDMDKLALLSDKGIKFIRVSNETLINSKLAEPEKRSAFQQNTYVIMLLAGLMNRDISRDDDMAQLARILKFYLLSHFKLEEVTAEKYLKALITDDLAVLVKGILLFMPMQHYEMPDYNLISEFLIKA
jgi:hypothetical protein